MNFRELRDALNALPEEDLDHQVTAFSKFWSKAEDDIHLDRDESGPYLYVMKKPWWGEKKE